MTRERRDTRGIVIAIGLDDQRPARTIPPLSRTPVAEVIREKLVSRRNATKEVSLVGEGGPIELLVV